jgi:SAM-dependent methyltransferase
MKQFIQDASYAGHFSDYRRILDRIINHDPAMFALPKDARIVDLGCGFGGLLDLMRQRGYTRLVGVEPDEECRRGAGARGLEIAAGTLSDSGLPGKFAEAVIVNQVFHHIEDYDAALREISRILVGGGYLCFMEPLNTPLRWGMDLLTFRTPLRHFAPPVETRYKVMKLETETGMYPQWLSRQGEFRRLVNQRFRREWHKKSWLFQFGKYQSLKH